MNHSVRVFLDSSALFSAVYSKRGAAREILRLGEMDDLQVVISSYVLIETEERLRRKAPKVVMLLPTLLAESKTFVVPDPPEDKKHSAAELVNDPYDVDIVAAAWAAKVDYFATFDQVHMIRNVPLRAALPFPLGTAGDCLEWFRGQIASPS